MKSLFLVPCPEAHPPRINRIRVILVLNDGCSQDSTLNFGHLRVEAEVKGSTKGVAYWTVDVY